MYLPEDDEGIEVLLTMHHVAQAAVVSQGSSTWVDFSITSLHHGTWEENCTGKLMLAMQDSSIEGK
jgi:hypothetical protein